MAPTPKKRKTRSRSNIRRNAKEHRIEIPNLVKCSSCGGLKMPHQACPNCGFYK